MESGRTSKEEFRRPPRPVVCSLAGTKFAGDAVGGSTAAWYSRYDPNSCTWEETYGMFVTITIFDDIILNGFYLGQGVHGFYQVRAE